MKIRHKLIIGFIIVTLLAGSVGVLGLYANNKVIKTFESGEEHFGLIVGASTEGSSYAKKAEGHLMLFLTLNDDSEKHKFFKSIESLREQNSIIETKLNNPDAKKIFYEIKSKTNELHSVGEVLIEAYDNEMKATGRFEPEDHKVMIRKLNKVSSEIRETGIKLAKLMLYLKNAQEQSVKKDASNLYNVILIIGLTSVLSAVVLGYVIAKKIAIPIMRLKEAAMVIGKGNLGTKIEIESNDEIGELAGSFNRMTHDLEKSNYDIISAKEYINSIIYSMSNALIVFSPNGTIQTVNSAACTLLGYKEEELIGQPINNVLTDRWEYDNLIKRELIREAETTFLSKDGKKIPVICSTSTMNDNKGNIQGIIYVAQDITERRRAAEALKKLSSVVEQGDDSVIITGNNDVVDYVNPAFEKLTGYTREEAIGKKANILKSGKHDTKFYEELYETIHSGRVYRGEIINKKKNGEIYIVTSTITPITDMQGNITYFVSTEKDITEHKKAEEQLKASLKEKELLLGEIHHRVKNNIQVISSMLSLQSEYITEKKYRDMFQESQNRILSMSLIHENLYQSRDFAKIDLNEYINDLVNDLFRYYGINTGNITLNINVENVYLGIDSGIPCGFIINELVTNCLKHAFPDGRKGELKISLRSIGEDMIELLISDNGIGIPKDLDFENTQSLGMYLVKMLAENQLQGEIHLDRSKGTEFKIKFKGEK